MKYLNLECDNVGLESGFTSSVFYKKDNHLLEFALNFQINFVLHLHEVVHILYKPFTLPVRIKQLPPYTIGCKTQIALIFKISLNKQPPYLIKIFLKLKIIYINCFIILKEPEWHIFCGQNVLFKILYPTTGKNETLKT